MARGAAYGEQQDARGCQDDAKGERDFRRRARRRVLGTPEPERSGTDVLHTRRGQAEDYAKASWRTRAGAMGGGSTASFRCRRIFRITSPCVMAAMIRSDPR